MKRLRFIATTLALTFLVTPSFAAVAQQLKNMPRIGFLHSADIATSVPSAAFFKALRELGYKEGRDIMILRRSAKGNHKRLADMTAELVRLKVDLIVGPGSGIRPAVKATRTIPIVVTVAGDYVARGWAKSLHRPGGNVTGLSTQADDLMGKQMELLKETVSGLKRIAIVYTPNFPPHDLMIKQAKEAAPALGLELVTIPVNAAADLSGAFRSMKDERVGGFLVLRSGFLVRLRNRMYDLATKARLPNISGHVRETVAGGLMSYGADTADLYRRAASYVDRILKGVRPGDLPIAQPEKFIMAVNLKTARVLGLTIPQSVQLRADQVIE